MFFPIADDVAIVGDVPARPSSRNEATAAVDANLSIDRRSFGEGNLKADIGRKGLFAIAEISSPSGVSAPNGVVKNIRKLRSLQNGPDTRSLPNNPEASAAIMRALKRYPELTVEGIGCGMAGPSAQDKPWREEEISTALEYHSLCRSRGSYWLKHRAEQWGHANGMAGYISNGSLITAAIALGVSCP